MKDEAGIEKSCVFLNLNKDDAIQFEQNLSAKFSKNALK